MVTRRGGGGIIPPEFFGLQGLGTAMQGIAENTEETRDRKRRRSAEDWQRAMAEAQAAQQTFGPGSEQHMKALQDLYGDEVQQEQIHIPFEHLMGQEQTAALQRIQTGQGTQHDYNLIHGIAETPEQLAQRTEQRLELGEYQVDEAGLRVREGQRAERDDRIRRDFLESKGHTPGSLQGLLDMYAVDQADANIDLTVAQAQHLRRQMAKLDLEIKKLSQVDNPMDDMMRDYIWMVAQETHLDPRDIAAGIGYGGATLGEDEQRAFNQRIGQVRARYQESIAGAAREARMSGNMEMLLLETAAENPELFGWDEETLMRQLVEVMNSVEPGGYDMATTQRAARGLWGVFGGTRTETNIARVPPLDGAMLLQEVNAAIEMYGPRAPDVFDINAARQRMGDQAAEAVHEMIRRGVAVRYQSSTPGEAREGRPSQDATTPSAEDLVGRAEAGAERRGNARGGLIPQIVHNRPAATANRELRALAHNEQAPPSDRREALDYLIARAEERRRDATRQHEKARIGREIRDLKLVRNSLD